MRAARLVAQAKLNLFLRVLGRETSGYHALETLFQRLALGDDVTVRVDTTGRARALDCRGGDTGPVERNLAWRAALAYAEAAGWPGGFAIEIDKRIPVGGGLGGGSADAGAVLRILNALAPRPLPAGRLLELALALGADVPFLTATAATALAWGRGERLLALPPLPARDVLLLLPDVGVPTADAFRWLAGARGSHVPTPRLLHVEQLAAWPAVAALAANDFEAPVAAHVPAVAALAAARGSLGGGDGGDALLFGMTGSGSTWFALSLEAAAHPPLPLPPGVRAVATRTAERVVEVQVME